MLGVGESGSDREGLKTRLMLRSPLAGCLRWYYYCHRSRRACGSFATASIPQG